MVEKLKNDQVRLELAKKRLDQEERIADAIEKQNKAFEKQSEVIDFESIIKKRISDLDDDRKERLAKINSLEKENAEIAKKYFGVNKKTGEEMIRRNNEKIKEAQVDEQFYKDSKERFLKQNDLAMEFEDIIEESGERAKQLGDNITGFVKGLPGGSFLVKKLGIEKLGQDLQENVINNMIDSFDPSKPQSAMGLLKNGFSSVVGFLGPAGAIAVGLGAIALGIRAIRNANRDLSKTLGVSVKEARGFQLELKASEMAFKAMGLNSEGIKSTMKLIGNEFGSLENMTVSNARNIERFAQNSGIASSEVVKLNKVFMDLTGSTFESATEVSKMAASMAKAANVQTSKVINDMQTSAEKFATFSMAGAQGFARAAVEAAKVGSSIEQVLTAADSLLQFETSIEASFKAQVLTGRQINTEKARQLALDGDIAGLTNEIQSIVGQVGDIESLNVLQRKSVANAIGISVSDLLKISRGEQVAATETVQEVLEEQIGITNKLLSTQNDKAAEFYATQQGTQEVSIATATY
tara:strand:- start:27 stop:1598 length:1572 start_codon:yes stop_codon:yes gene_type:complete